jgi:hypothetical protein
MSLLSELQASFCMAMLAGDDATVSEWIVEDGISAAGRLDIYRHHVLTSLTNVLASTYPVIVRLVDRRFFDYVADRFVRSHPPAGPCLFEYGADFPQFLTTVPACAHLEYLPDVARLEWAMDAALWAPEARPFDRTVLANDDVHALTFRLDPSVTLLRSSWPVDQLWRANQVDADPDTTVDLDSGGALLEIRRLGDDVVFRRLAPAVFAFREALARGATLEAAVTAALGTADGFDVAAAVTALLDDAVLVA